MYYLSLFFILCGIILLFYSFFSGNKKNNSSCNDSLSNSNEFVAPDLHAEEPVKPEHPCSDILTDEDAEEYDVKFSGVEDEILTEGLEGNEFSDELLSAEIEEAVSNQDDEKTEVAVNNDPLAVQAVLFEDSSCLVDYSRESGRIDPTLEKYNKIKRIGRGKFCVEQEGISFYSGKKFFRYDFHMIEKLFSGQDYISLVLKGTTAVKLAIFEHGNETIDMVLEKYAEYTEEFSRTV